MRLLQATTYILFHTQSLVAKLSDRFDHSLVNGLVNLDCSSRLIIDYIKLVGIFYSIYQQTRKLTQLDLSYLNTHLSHRHETFVHALLPPQHSYSQAIVSNSCLQPSNCSLHYYSCFLSKMPNREHMNPCLIHIVSICSEIRIEIGTN